MGLLCKEPGQTLWCERRYGLSVPHVCMSALGEVGAPPQRQAAGDIAARPLKRQSMGPLRSGPSPTEARVEHKGAVAGQQDQLGVVVAEHTEVHHLSVQVALKLHGQVGQVEAADLGLGAGWGGGALERRAIRDVACATVGAKRRCGGMWWPTTVWYPAWWCARCGARKGGLNVQDGDVGNLGVDRCALVRRRCRAAAPAFAAQDGHFVA